MSTPNSTIKPSRLFDVQGVLKQLFEKPPITLGLILEVTPAVYLVVYGRGSAAGVVLLAAMSLLIIAMSGGLKVAVLNAAIFSVLLALTCVVSGHWLAAAALALVVALWASLGAASGKGIMISMPAAIMAIMIMIPPQITHSQDPHTWRNTVAVLLYAGVASAWGVLIGILLRRGRTIPTIPGATLRWGMTQGLMVGVVMAGAAAYATYRNLGQGGAWLLLTIFLVFKPLAPTPWRRSLDRAFGTALGVAIVAIYLATMPTSAPPMALLIPAAMMLVAAALTLIAQRWPYWCYVTLFTPAVVLFLACVNSPSKTVSTARYLDTLRIEYSILGIVIALAAQGILIGARRGLRLENSSWFGHSAQADPGGT
jgi:Fusaric acid resistance protein-like